jgi:hypothetical protein
MEKMEKFVRGEYMLPRHGKKRHHKMESVWTPKMLWQGRKKNWWLQETLGISGKFLAAYVSQL